MLALLSRLWRQISFRRKTQLAVLFVLMIIVSIAEMISIGAVLPFLGVLTAPEWVFGRRAVQPLIHVLGLTEPAQLVKPLTILFAIAALISGGLRVALYWAQTRLGHAIGADFSISIYRRTLYQPYDIHLGRNSSEIISGITMKADSIVYQAVLPCLVILSSGMLLTAILLTLLAMEPIVAFATFGGFGLIYAFTILVTKNRLMRDSNLIDREHTQVIKAVQEALGGIRDVLIDGTQEVYCKAYQNADQRLRRAHSSIIIIGGSPRYIVEALGMALIAILAYVLASQSDGLSGAIPIMGALALGAQRMLPVLQNGYASWSTMRGGQESLRAALGLLEQPMPAYSIEYKSGRVSFDQQIALEGVGFRYAEQSPWVLRGLNLTIAKGSRIGFIGNTGSGKSTLLDIIMGLLSPSEGWLKLDGHVIAKENCRAWQMCIAHVPQTIFLADASIAENIAFGVPVGEIDFQRVKHSAKSAQISDAIESWEDQYGTLVGERGVRLSGGQRQRIGIARALYKEANVIIFDEATSALDSDTENAVMEAINSLGKELTIIMVAHRLSTLRSCTQVVELANGTVKSIGTYQQLVEFREK